MVHGLHAVPGRDLPGAPISTKEMMPPCLISTYMPSLWLRSSRLLPATSRRNARRSPRSTATKQREDHAALSSPCLASLFVFFSSLALSRLLLPFLLLHALFLSLLLSLSVRLSLSLTPPGSGVIHCRRPERRRVQGRMESLLNFQTMVMDLTGETAPSPFVFPPPSRLRHRLCPV